VFDYAPDRLHVLRTEGVGGFCCLAPSGILLTKAFERRSPLSDESVMRQFLVQLEALDWRGSGANAVYRKAIKRWLTIDV
jgi:hypothetical protein